MSSGFHPYRMGQVHFNIPSTAVQWHVYICFIPEV